MSSAEQLIRRLSRWLPCGLLVAAPAFAGETVYLTTEQFVAETFADKTPRIELLWVTKDVSAQASHILGHAPPQLRQRYWSDGAKSAWVLEEIGKEEPITAGFVVRDGRIEQARVLTYRESRGMEIHYPVFLKQYAGTGLAPDYRLDKNIDGISGATLSVRAMERMTRLALYYDRIAHANK
ncbi:MAG TPA: FMN-binding protein [Novimethylophilus sp.]|uniref:FMN-binding protein n=1 Tax=Novimethylophilus sp. TaxID=2137426 RepID=UPI002F3F2E7B